MTLQKRMPALNGRQLHIPPTVSVHAKKPYHLLNVKKIVCIFLFLTALTDSNGQDSFRLYNPDLGNYLKIKNFNFLCDFDTISGELNLKFWNTDKTGIPVIVDSGGFLFGSNIYAFGSKKRSEFLILWVTEDEYISDIRVYILDSDTITKIGNLPIRRVCNDCDELIYPIEKLKIYAQGNEFVIIPTISFEYGISNESLQKFSAGQLSFIIDKDKRKIISTKR